MKFMHTADWQIGMKAAHAGEVGARVRAERLEAAGRAVERARESGAEFMLIAGDVFEDNGVERVEVQKVADLIARFDRPVFIIPGNHDPLVPGSVWEHPSWRSHPNVRILTEPEPVEIPGGTLYPCPVLEKFSTKDPTSWIPAEDIEGFRIGMAHGSVEGVDPADRYHPVARDAAERSALDYLALGHWHSFTPYERDGAVRMAYSGTLEPTRFGERDSGRVLLVEITEPKAAPVITTERTGGLQWTSLAEEIVREGDLEKVRRRVESFEEPGDRLLQLVVSGLLHFEETDEIDRIKEIAASRFLYSRIDTSGLHPVPEDAALASTLPAGVIRDAALRISLLADPAYAGEHPEEATPEVAALALLELYALAKEVEA